MSDAPAALSGALTFATAAQWFARVETLSAQATIDLSAVTHCDSAGAALLLELQRRAHSKGRTLSFTHVPAQLRELFTFFGLDSVLRLAA